MLFAKMHRIIYSKMMDFFWIPSNFVELKIVYEIFEMTINRTYTFKTLSFSHFKWLRISTFIFFYCCIFLSLVLSLSSAFFSLSSLYRLESKIFSLSTQFENKLMQKCAETDYPYQKMLHPVTNCLGHWDWTQFTYRT